MSKKKETCAKCHKTINTGAKKLNGKTYHSLCRETVLRDKYGK